MASLAATITATSEEEHGPHHSLEKEPLLSGQLNNTGPNFTERRGGGGLTTTTTLVAGDDTTTKEGILSPHVLILFDRTEEAAKALFIVALITFLLGFIRLVSELSILQVPYTLGYMVSIFYLVKLIHDLQILQKKNQDVRSLIRLFSPFSSCQCSSSTPSMMQQEMRDAFTSLRSNGPQDMKELLEYYPQVFLCRVDWQLQAETMELLNQTEMTTINDAV